MRHTHFNNEIEEHKGSDILSDVLLWVCGIVFVLVFIHILAGIIYGAERVDEMVADIIIKLLEWVCQNIPLTA